MAQMDGTDVLVMLKYNSGASLCNLAFGDLGQNLVPVSLDVLSSYYAGTVETSFSLYRKLSV